MYDVLYGVFYSAVGRNSSITSSAAGGTQQRSLSCLPFFVIELFRARFNFAGTLNLLRSRSKTNAQPYSDGQVYFGSSRRERRREAYPEEGENDYGRC